MAQIKLQADGLNLADTFAFTGTVTGAGGITEADQWRMTAGMTSNGDITSNLERVDEGTFSKIGTGMSQSSGIWTFPSTGIYLIRLLIQGYSTSGDTINGYINVSVNSGASFTPAARANFSGVSCYNNSTAEYICDVTDTSTIKVRFDVSSIGGSAEVVGNTDESWTYFTFIRLGDT